MSGDNWRDVFNVDKIRDKWQPIPGESEPEGEGLPPERALQTLSELRRMIEAEFGGLSRGFVFFLTKAEQLIARQIGEDGEMVDEKELLEIRQELDGILNKLEDLLEAALLQKRNG